MAAPRWAARAPYLQHCRRGARMDNSSRECVPKLWGEKPIGGHQGGIATRLRAQRGAHFGKTRGLPPPLCRDCFPPTHTLYPRPLSRWSRKVSFPNFSKVS